MTTVTQLQQNLQDVLHRYANQAGRDHAFVRRQRNLSGASFVQTLVWGWLANPEATLEELSQTAALCGVTISPQGLAQRMTAQAANCLRAVLEASLLAVAQGGTGTETFLQRFNGVYLLDSTTVPLPKQWETLWPGCGNQHGASAALKVQTLWDYQQGNLHVSLHPGRDHDLRLPVPPLPAGALRISDSGYFHVEALQALAADGGYYLTRVPCKVRLHDPVGKVWRLSDFLRRYADPDFDGWVCLTTNGLACRLLAQRAPEAVVAQRQARLRQAAKRKGKTVSQEALALAAWTLLVTNLPDGQLSFAEAFVLLRLRWQIELLFKLWKQHSHLEQSRSHQPDRRMCEIYAKLLGLLLQHAVLLATCWDVPNRSLVKLAKTLRKFTFMLADALWADTAAFVCVLDTLRRVLRAGCRLNTRKARPSHFQLLLHLS
jgi:DDE family transposase